MQISPINNTQNSNTNFKKLIISEAAMDIIKELPKRDAAHIKTWENRLANSKFFDLRISAGPKNKKTLNTFLYRKDSHRTIGEGPIKTINGFFNTLRVKVKHGIMYGNTNNIIDLEFESAGKAKLAKMTTSRIANIYSTNPDINKIGRAVKGVEMLEEAFAYKEKPIIWEEDKNLQKFSDIILKKIGKKNKHIID